MRQIKCATVNHLRFNLIQHVFVINVDDYENENNNQQCAIDNEERHLVEPTQHTTPHESIEPNQMLKIIYCHNLFVLIFQPAKH